MIVYSDLRPGNFVKTDSTGKMKLLKLSLEDLLSIKSGKLEVLPVLIAGKWLMRFGFSQNETFAHFKLHPVYVICDNGGWYFVKRQIKINTHPLLYIHQLQNLFYAMCGEDLTIS